MFSEPAPAPDSLSVFRITVNGRPLQQADFRIYRWDMIENPLIAMDKIHSTEDFAYDRQKAREYLDRVGAGALYRQMQPHLENAPNLEQRFPIWYRSYLGRLLGYPVDSLRVDRCRYIYRDGRLQLINKETYITL
jgi:hypothetical protein